MVLNGVTLPVVIRVQIHSTASSLRGPLVGANYQAALLPHMLMALSGCPYNPAKSKRSTPDLCLPKNQLRLFCFPFRFRLMSSRALLCSTPHSHEFQRSHLAVSRRPSGQPTRPLVPRYFQLNIQLAATCSFRAAAHLSVRYELPMIDAHGAFDYFT